MCDSPRHEINSEESSTETSEAEDGSASSESEGGSSTESLVTFPMKDVRILVIGLTGHGKSSLINKMMDSEVADVGHGAQACQHKKYIEKHTIGFVDSIKLHFYDTQGMGDAKVSGDEIFEAIRSELKKVDLIIICHMLYGRAEGAIKQMLHQVVQECGKELLKNHSVLCYTHADLYKSYVTVPRDKKGEANLKKQFLEEEVQRQRDSLTEQIKHFLVTEGKVLTEEEFDDIPICISSTKKTDLPTASHWRSEFMQCCAIRSKPDGGRFITWFEKNKKKIAVTAVGTGATGVTAVTVGAIMGGAAGTVVPGVGTVAGALVGAAAGGAAVGVATVASMWIAKLKKSKRKRKSKLYK